MQRPTKKKVNNELHSLRMFVSAWDRGGGGLLKMATTVTCFSHICTRSWSVTDNRGLSCQQQTAFSRVKGSIPDNLFKNIGFGKEDLPDPVKSRQFSVPCFP